MHELGLSEGLLATVVGIAGDRPVSRVRVSIGALQRVVPDSLEFGFRLVAEGTVCEAARLEVAHLPVRVRCMACGVESHTDEEPIGCPACGAGSIEMLGGAEVLLDEIELSGSPPTVIRRAGLEVEEPPHEHEHDHDHGHTHGRPSPVGGGG
jgi:hydrogenase nickel incorporation protein HypA/HybF